MELKIDGHTKGVIIEKKAKKYTKRAHLFSEKKVETIISGSKQQKKTKKWWLFPVVILSLLLTGGAFISFKILRTIAKTGLAIDLQIFNPFENMSPTLAKTDNRTNLLVIGIDTRPDNKGLLNTDTIMIISYNHLTEEVAYVSIPRDIEANYELNGQKYVTKINGIYAHAETAIGPGGGMKILREQIELITGLHIHYAVLINYYAFVKIIDTLGGVDICVDRSFTSLYPKPGNEPGSSIGDENIIVSFTAGCQHMDGERALVYARARRSLSVEGSDYARIIRQQKVVTATYEKLKQSSFFTQFNSIIQFIDIIGDNIRLYDISTNDLKAAWDIRDKIKFENATNLVLSPTIAHSKLLDTNTSNYHVYPISGKWDEVRSFISFVLNNPVVYKEDPEVVVYNAGGGFQAAADITTKLNNAWLRASYAGKVTSDCKGTIISALTDKDPPTESIIYIQKILETATIDKPPVEVKSTKPIAVFVCAPQPNEPV